MNTIFIVENNSDLTEGRGPMRTVAIFSSEEEAIKCRNLQPTIMGTRPLGSDARIVVSTVFDTFYEYQEGTASAIRESAIKKLTPKERRVLGV